MSCQSVADAIGYWKFADGLEKRVLEYGFCRERTWEKVVGDPEAWEQAVFEGREGYVPGQNPVVGKTLSHFSNFDLQKVGEMLELPGFGTPAPGESWTKQEVS
ncbi:hypothetical protein [Desulfonema ishimotonii]|uniref:hypothetical protein n=1 Tax=Desulfonema ishimotonii TaxID=45657 RepID=UPI000F5670C1|nr:hypothetical protein [Desulfonema ishimotonii]